MAELGSSALDGSILALYSRCWPIVGGWQPWWSLPDALLPLGSVRFAAAQSTLLLRHRLARILQLLPLWRVLECLVRRYAAGSCRRTNPWSRPFGLEVVTWPPAWTRSPQASHDPRPPSRRASSSGAYDKTDAQNHAVRGSSGD